MLRQYCFLNAPATKISSRHSLKAGTITNQHLMGVATLELASQCIINHLITNQT